MEFDNSLLFGGISAVVVICGCFLVFWKSRKKKGLFTIWENSVPIVEGNSPKDYHESNESQLPELVAANPKVIVGVDSGKGIEEYVSEESNKLAQVNKSVGAVSAGSLKALLLTLSHLARVSEEKRAYMLKMFEESKKAQLESLCSKIQAENLSELAESKEQSSRNLKIESGGAVGGVLTGAAIGVWFGGVGAPVGAAIGGVCGWIGGKCFGKEINHPEKMGKTEIEMLANKELGYRVNPGFGVKNLILDHTVRINSYDLALAQTSLVTFE
ncbi:MAG: hypothetical protein KDD68_19275, partial [Bdellovibrionales bacterium]|nr:hypothetical protein [Bdellovibrionales bacterium]